MKVYNLNEEQKDVLIGQTYDGIQYFNPSLDRDGNWFISVEEFNFLTSERAQELNVLEWWGTLSLIEFKPVESRL